jgi:hypothetical protein
MFRYIITALAVLLAGQATAQQDNKGGTAIDYTLIGAPMPFFRLVVLDTAEKATTLKQPKKKKKQGDEDKTTVVATVTSNNFTNKGNLFVMMFSPTCEHCENETGLLEKNIGLFKEGKLVLMTNPKFKEYLPTFMKKLNTMQYPQLSVGLDDSDFIKETFLYQPLPQINIYNSQRKLIKTFSGDTPIDSLKPYMN